MKPVTGAEDESRDLHPVWVAAGWTLGLLGVQVASGFELWGAPGVVHIGDLGAACLLHWAAVRVGGLPPGRHRAPPPVAGELWFARGFGMFSAVMLLMVALGAPPSWAGAAGAVGKGCVLLLVLRLVSRARTPFIGALSSHAVLLNPPATVVSSFALAILCGWLLLALPQAGTEGRPLGPLDALFTATSATCVTGLIVKDTPRDFSPFGQVVILLLIQAGGLGIMTLAGVFSAARGRRVSLRQRMIAHDTVVMHEWRSIGATLRSIALYVFAFELAGALALWLRWWQSGAGTGQAAWLAAFHAVSAFCNAGFSLFSTSLEAYAGDAIIVGVVGGLIIIGGLGFPVSTDLWRVHVLRRQGRRGRLSLHSRLTLVTTGGLLVVGFAGFLVLEWAGALAGRGVLESVYAGGFQSVTARTAGFNTVPVSALTDATRFLLILLMFIGASPGSTGGGIKTATFAVLVCLARTMIYGGSHVHVFGRAIPEAVRHRAVAIVILFGVFVLIWTFALSVSESARFMDLLFEAVSAFGTVGLSAGVTPMLTAFGKLAIIAAMFMGRVGPLTLALAVAQRKRRVELTHPEETVMVG